MSTLAALSIRDYQPGDASDCAQLLYDSVHGGTGRFYSLEQRRAWAPTPHSAETLNTRLAGQVVVLAEDAAGIAGFMSFEPPHTLDFAYVRLDRLGSGVGDALYDHLIDRILATVTTEHLETHASELAQRFFLRRGWRVIGRNHLERNGVELHNYTMRLDGL